MDLYGTMLQDTSRRWTAPDLLIAGVIDAAEPQQMVLFLGSELAAAALLEAFEVF